MFKKYNAYQSTNIKTIGCIPNSWNIIKLKNVLKAKITDGPHETPVFIDEGVPFLSVDAIQEGELVFEGCRYISPEKHAKYSLKCKVEKNDILMGKAASTGKIARIKVDFPFSIWSPLALIKIDNCKAYPEFIEFSLKSRASQIQIDDLCTLNTQKNISMGDIPKINLALPSLETQREIISFLISSVSNLDQAIAIKEQQISLLNERKQIVIQKAVTQGLYPNVSMKDSGVEWIGQIPEHWEVRANRTIFKERNEQGQEGLPLLSISIHSGVSNEEVSEEENVRGRIKIEDKSKYILVKKGDIAFNMMRAWQGGIGAVSVDGMVSPAYIVAKPNKLMNSEFFEYQYRCPEFIQQMDRYSKGITDFRKRLYWDGFKQLMTIVPPIDEQQEIINYIKKVDAQTAFAIDVKKQQIEKLKEYKTTLINDAVTGKIKVA